MLWHLTQIIFFRKAIHFLRSKLKILLVLRVQQDFFLEVRSAGGGGMNGGGKGSGGVGSCEVMSEPVTDMSLSPWSYGIAEMIGRLPGGWHCKLCLASGTGL